MQIKQLATCQVQSRCSINGAYYCRQFPCGASPLLLTALAVPETVLVIRTTIIPVSFAAIQRSPNYGNSFPSNYSCSQDFSKANLDFGVLSSYKRRTWNEFPGSYLKGRQVKLLCFISSIFLPKIWPLELILFLFKASILFTQDFFSHFLYLLLPISLVQCQAHSKHSGTWWNM